MTVNGVSNRTTTLSTTQTNNSNILGKQQFLNLLITQLRYQDPLNPMEDKEFVAQLAQFSALEQMQNTNKNLQLIHANNLIAKYVVAKVNEDDGQKEISGLVNSIKIDGDKIYLKVNDTDVDLNDVTQIGADDNIIYRDKYLKDILNKIDQLYSTIPSKSDISKLIELIGGVS